MSIFRVSLKYEISFIPWNVAPGITKHHAETSLYRSLKENYGVHNAKTIEHTELILVYKNCSSYLKCDLGLPCFYIETIAKDNRGIKVEFSRSYYRGDNINFVIERNYT